MKNLLMIASAATLFSLAAPALAERAASGPTTFAAWSQDVHDRISGALADPHPLGRRELPEGIVEVSFRAGKDGAPSDVKVRNSSGLEKLDHRAVRAVRSIGTLPPPPAGLVGGQPFVARILFLGGDRRVDARRIERMIADAAARNRWYTDSELAAAETPAIRLTAAQ